MNVDDVEAVSNNNLLEYILWPKPLTEMTVVKLSYQLKLTNHTILYKVIECQIKVGSHCKSDQLQGERRKLTARYEALMTSSCHLTQQR